jgi:site-specific DNA-methyltransferase (adenine-specific)
MKLLTHQERLRFGEPWDGSPLLLPAAPPPLHATPLGVLFEGDCLEVLTHIRDESVDTVFADPPFNLGKNYGHKHNDARPDEHYLAWCRAWLDECTRVLKPGGALFVYNLPKWNIRLGSYLMDAGLVFRHDIAVNIKLSLPIPGRLYPSHYSLLYLTKGKPKTFRRIRTPIERCRHCGGEIKDYGGHRHAMNPKGVNLTDVWNDIPPVRHWKFKSKRRGENQLSTKLIWRCVQMSTYPGEIVLDPFGGAGTTFDVCEHTGRRWLGIEIQHADVIVERLETADLAHHRTTDVIDDSSSPELVRPAPSEFEARSG